MKEFKELFSMVAHHTRELVIAAQLAAAVVGAVIGGWNGTIKVFVILVALDYLAGILRAANNGVLNSTAGFNGIVKKTGYFIIIAVFFQVGNYLGDSHGQAMFVRGLVVNIFIVNEIVSILENVRHLNKDGEYLPAGIIEVLEQLLAEDIRTKLKMGDMPVPGEDDSSSS